MTSHDAWLGDVLLAAAGAVGARLVVDDGQWRRTSEEAATVLGLPCLERACVVIVDGLGEHNLAARADAAPVLAGSPRQALLTGTPSTTATSLASIGTGLRSGSTGMLGYTVRHPRGSILNLISFGDGTDPMAWQRCPTIFERLAEQGIESVSVGPWAFENSALTRAALRGAAYESAESLRERVDRTLDVLHEPDVPLVTMYWGDIDKTGHRDGWTSHTWRDQLAELDVEMGRLAAGAPPGTVVLVTADHGMVDVPRGGSAAFAGPARLDVAADARLSDGVPLTAGEPRLLHVYAEPGASGQVRSSWRSVLGERADVRSRDEAIAAGWFGPVADHLREVVGDVVVAALGDIAITDSRTQTPASLELVGMHGSRTSAERTVPLIRLVGP